MQSSDSGDTRSRSHSLGCAFRACVGVCCTVMAQAAHYFLCICQASTVGSNRRLRGGEGTQTNGLGLIRPVLGTSLCPLLFYLSLSLMKSLTAKNRVVEEQ